ncbi:MAG: polysaccharide deacetylase family protein [Fimbriimonas sp.]
MRVPILMYHRIAPLNPQSVVKGHYVHPKMFARQMGVLARLGYQAVPLRDLYDSDKTLPSKAVVVTFDDGYKNFSDNALPALISHSFASTVFLVANLIGKSNEWDQGRGDVKEPLMGLQEIEMAADNGTEIGSHTLDHADLTAVDTAEAWRQIAESKAVLEKVLGTEVGSFCYPYGRKTPEVQAMVRKAGYRLACSTEKGLNHSNTDRTALRRINVRSDTLMPVFLYKLIRGARVAR